MGSREPSSLFESSLEEGHSNTFNEVLNSVENFQTLETATSESTQSSSRQPVTRANYGRIFQGHERNTSGIPYTHCTQTQSGFQENLFPTIIVADRTGGFIWDRQAILHAVSPYYHIPLHSELSHSLSFKQREILASGDDDAEVVSIDFSNLEDSTTQYLAESQSNDEF